MTFKTKKTAETHLYENPTKYMPDWFCPLINASCNATCWCYMQPYVYKRSSGYGETASVDFLIYGNTCENGMFQERYYP